MWSNIVSPTLNNHNKGYFNNSSGSNSIEDAASYEGDSSNQHQWSESSSGYRKNWTTKRRPENFGSPLTRYKHSVCAASNGYIYIYGGRCGNLPLEDDVWRFDPHQNTWTQIETTGCKPPNLQEHTSVEYGDRLYVFGGQVTASRSDETFWRLDLASNVWSSLNMKSTKYGAHLGPTNRRGHSAVIYGDSMYIFGGYEDFRGSSAQLWEYNLVCERWELRNLSSTSACHPEPRHSHSAIVHSDSMFIYGGLSNLKPMRDLWRWSWRDKRWYKMRTKGKSPGYLHGHSAVLAFESMFIFGGERDGRTTRGLWRLNLTNMVWHKIRPKGPQPSPTTWHGAVANPLGILDAANYIVEGDVDTSPLKSNNEEFDLENDRQVSMITNSSSIERETRPMTHSKSVSGCTKSEMSKLATSSNRSKRLKRLQLKFLRRNRDHQDTSANLLKPSYLRTSTSESSLKKTQEGVTLDPTPRASGKTFNKDSIEQSEEQECKDEHINGKILDNLDNEIKQMFDKALTDSLESPSIKREKTDLNGDSIISSSSNYKTAIPPAGSTVSNLNSTDFRSQRTSFAYTTPPSEMNNQCPSSATLANEVLANSIIASGSHKERGERPKSELVQSLIDRADDRIKHLFTPFFDRPNKPNSSKLLASNLNRSSAQYNRQSIGKKVSHRHSFMDKFKRHTIHQTMTYYNLYFPEDRSSSQSDESSENRPDSSSKEENQMDCSDENEETQSGCCLTRDDLSSSTIKNFRGDKLESSTGTLIGVRGGSQAERDSLESNSRTLCGELESSNNNEGCNSNGTSDVASSRSHALTYKRDAINDYVTAGLRNGLGSRNESIDNTSLSFSAIAEFEEDDILQYSSPTDPSVKHNSSEEREDVLRVQTTDLDSVSPSETKEVERIETSHEITHKSASSGYESICNGIDNSPRSIFSKRKSKNRYWQLCMFVIGGKQGKSQGTMNEPISIWRLYI